MTIAVRAVRVAALLHVRRQRDHAGKTARPSLISFGGDQLREGRRGARRHACSWWVQIEPTRTAIRGSTLAVRAGASESETGGYGRLRLSESPAPASASRPRGLERAHSCVPDVSALTDDVDRGFSPLR